ncbi:MAG: Glu/Leu/Phe/Val dehydrogenase [Proteobacteria bacterium]|nr:Glu/Leu/Phe/Val dehydrogenase [Pseudomonadota bacterium]
MDDSVFRFCDDLGPKSILHLYQPAIGLKGIVVVDNVAAGPSIGGVRMAPDVSLEECFRLARAMTFKNAAAGLPHGGGKSVIFADPSMDAAQKERLIRAFAKAIEPITDYIPGPDMGTDETAMAWVKDEIGRCAGLPRELGGIPLDEIGATAFGLLAAAEIAAQKLELSLHGARVSVQGFGAVGKNAARFFVDQGAVLVAAADSSGTVFDARGIDVDALIAHKEQGAPIREFSAGDMLDRDAVIGVDCDILIPAARPDVIRADNQDTVKAKLIVQGANIGVTGEAEALLHKRGVLCIPDFIANAGGVICAAVEYRGGTQVQAFEVIDESIRANTAEILRDAEREEMLPREAAVRMAKERVRTAMRFRRWH